MSVSKDEAQRLRHHDTLKAYAGFARESSPLMASMIRRIGVWFSGGAEVDDARKKIATSVFSYLEVGSEGRDHQAWMFDLEPALRLSSSLHAYVLEGDPRVTPLCPYYRTVGGSSDPEEEAFDGAFAEVLAALGEELFERARKWTVQTNETSRGLAWLLPAAVLGAEAVHLVEFGASAGLNLYAEQRRYTLAWGQGEQAKELTIGCASKPQFRFEVDGPFLDVPPAQRHGPEVLSRSGGDLHPLDVRDPAQRTMLSACIWGDEPERMQRLREGLEVHQRALTTKSPAAKLFPLTMPDELAPFLTKSLPVRPHAPVISFNTYATAYLRDVQQRAVQRRVAEFARRYSLRHGVPWLWVRFEPARRGETPPPHPGWCRWRLEVWQGSSHQEFDLGWAHPHLHRIELNEAGVKALLELRGDEG